MGDLFGSVRRSLVFRTASDHDETPPPVASTSTTAAVLVDKISSCVRKSRIFSKPSSPSIGRENAPPIRWRRGELIGCGAFGRVYTGMNLDSGELLAVKQVLIAANAVSKEKSQAHIRELEEEVKLLKNLSHPNIVRYLGTIREEDTLNILLEFVPGGSISSLLGKFGAFPETVMRTYTKQLLLGLEYLHNNGIMHRDIKGANILVDNKGCIKLADFGASKQVVELATGSGAKSMKGTPYWMAPEVILQTGHSFSADIWSVGCTVIEMATGKPPWSQQYLEVAAVLFHIGTTKSHPPIPEHLSEPAKDFLLRCLQREPDLRPTASQLLQHPFVTGQPLAPQSTTCTSALEQSELSSASNTPEMNASQMSDMCNLGSLSGSIVSPQKFDYICNNADDDMCQIDSMMGTPDKSIKSFNPMSEPSVDWRCKFDETPIPQQTGMKESSVPGPTGDLSHERNEFSFPSGNSLPEEDDELTESKIRDFLDEKAMELKKLQTPLYEEFYNSINTVCSPVFPESSRDEKETPKYLKLPPKSRSPSRGTPGNNTDIVGSASPGSNSSRHISNAGNLSGQSSPDVALSPLLSDARGPAAADVPNESISPMLSKSERERKWKEELDRELERQREMMRQAGSGGKTSSPIDRAMNRPREKTRFASPGK